MNRFEVPSGPLTLEREIKRSRFIVHVDRIGSREQFMALLQTRRAVFPDAGHHCWAYVAGAPGDLTRADKSDDGEPRGTAGKPMLHALSLSGVGEIGAVVTRFFGGVKLGAGGLVRAYGGCVSDALGELATETRYRTETWTLDVPYALVDSLEHQLKATRVAVVDRQFAEHVTVILDVPLDDADALGAEIDALGQGSIARRTV
ncbi:MAG: YigZ family protein [Pseudomonadota bacterium]